MTNRLFRRLWEKYRRLITLALPGTAPFQELARRSLLPHRAALNRAQASVFASDVADRLKRMFMRGGQAEKADREAEKREDDTWAEGVGV